MVLSNPSLMTWPRVHTRTVRWSWQHFGLGAVLLLAAVLNTLFLSQNGYGNAYYAAAVKSMLSSWHNFFFASFDPGGFVTVDKPPLALWIQTASAWLFGYSSWSLLLPQAIAGVASVGLLYHLVGRTWGRGAGLIAALALALTPIAVAINRDNNPDPLLVLTLLLAAWAGIKATESGRLRWVLLCGALVGAAFDIKMLQALIVVPAFGLMYLLGSSLPWRRRIAHLAAGLAALVVVGGAWPTVVDLTPATQRPYVGGSTTNSEWELILGYNGLSRILGGQGPGAARTATDIVRSTTTTTTTAAGSTATASQARDFGGGMAGGMFGSGTPGALRLLTQQVGTQINWLLPLAAIGAIVAWGKRFRLPLTRKQQSLVLWGAWFLTHLVVFSFAQGIFHSYYTVMMAPALAALVGIGTVALWQAYRQGGRKAALLPLALVATTAYEVYLLAPYSTYSRILIPIVVGAGVIATGILIAGSLRRRIGITWTRAAAVLGLAALLVAPGVWSATTLAAPLNGTMPSAGPSTSRGGPGGTIAAFNPGGTPSAAAAAGTGTGTTTGSTTTATTSSAATGTPPTGTAGAGSNGGQPGGMGDTANQALISYLQAHQDGYTYLVATLNAGSAESIIIQTGEPVMALGGFSGSDQILTTTQLETLVQNKTVRYFLIQGNGGPGGQSGGNSALVQWIEAHGTLVSPSALTGTASSTTTPTSQSGMGTQLYVVAG